MTCLLELRLWDLASEADQDAAITAVHEALGPDFQRLDPSVFVCGQARHRVGRFLFEAIGVEFHLIPGGGREVYAGHYSSPVEERAVRPFLMARYAVHQELWDRFEGRDKRRFHGPERPIEGLSQNSARDFLRAVDGLQRLRCPTENEWEHAAWAGCDLRFPWGLGPDPRYMWFDANSQGQSQSIYAHKDWGNGFGLVDILGHVWELCAEGHASGGDLDSHAYAFDLEFQVQKQGPTRNVGLRLALSIPDLA